MDDYAERNYLSAIEVAGYLGMSVREVHALVEREILPAAIAASGQYRFALADIQKIEREYKKEKLRAALPPRTACCLGKTVQEIAVQSAQELTERDNSVHLVITSPPYFDAKMYSSGQVPGDLGNIHALDDWFAAIKRVWEEVYRVLAPGRKFFLNIMNLPVREGTTFRSLNLVGRSIDVCTEIGFVFKRDIVWEKTNGVRAHFGTYPYPGGILINNMHEFILEFNKPDDRSFPKYAHVTADAREQSKLDKEFWLSLKNSDVWRMSPEKSGDRRQHIAPFPLELPYRLIKAFSFAGETVLDPFAGSGTTLLAAARLGRNGIGYEINPEYAAAAIERLAAERLAGREEGAPAEGKSRPQTKKAAREEKGKTGKGEQEGQR